MNLSDEDWATLNATCKDVQIWTATQANRWAASGYSPALEPYTGPKIDVILVDYIDLMKPNS